MTDDRNDNEMTNSGASLHVVESLDRFLDGELSEEAERAVAAHLNSCAECARVFERRMRVKRAVKVAVERETAPADLREAVGRSIRASTTPAVVIPLETIRRWSYGIAATILLALGTWGASRLFTDGDSPGGGSPEVIVRKDTITAPVTKVLDIGLGDHIFCAVRFKYADKRFTFEQMAEKMGAEYIGLVPIVREKVPDYEVVVAHQCSFHGRRFIHMILRKGPQIVSLAITRKGSDTFGADTATAAAFAHGVPLFQARLQNLREFDVIGFETAEYLAFIVSDLPRQDNMRVAEAIAPEVRDFLNGSRRG